MTLRIQNPGLLTTVQDIGRVGHQHEGIPASGAMDEWALRVGNVLVGNDERDAALEATLVGPSIYFVEDTLMVLTGADLAAGVGGCRLPSWHPVLVRAGETVTFAGSNAGSRAYLVVAGGIAVTPVLGSRSTYVRASFGGHQGRALRRGDELPVGTPSALAERIAMSLRRASGSASGPVVARWGAAPSLRPTYSVAPLVRLLDGAHAAMVAPASRQQLFEAEFRVSTRSDRMGYRLEGPPLELAVPDAGQELLSEAVAFGTMQLPSNGSPIVLMADRQTTGGYPRIAEVASVDLPLLAQARPGDRVRFRPISLEEAQRLYLAREQDLAEAVGRSGFGLAPPPHQESMPTVDLNCDMGESFGAYRIGADEEILPFVSSANIACGFHGGDPAVMRRTLTKAMELGVAVGAHPGFQDLVGFGRRNMDVTPQEAYDLMVYQIGSLMGFAAVAGARLRHVKAHGALYNMAVTDPELADAIARAVRDVDRSLVLFGLAGSGIVSAGESLGLATASETFADRNYMPDGSLVSRRRSDAMITDADEAVRRALRMVMEGRVRAVDGSDISLRADTICLHGDGAHAVEFARRLREAFDRTGVEVRPVGPPGG